MTAFALLGLTAPVLAIAMMLVRLTSRGPAIFHQSRSGLNGQVFSIYKIRSMYCDAGRRTGPWWSPLDPRITPFGRFLRATQIDELPQLWNVLCGEMSLIGPRPERPQFVDELARIIPFYRERAYVKPGITGWAQVNYPYGASVEDARAELPPGDFVEPAFL